MILSARLKVYALVSPAHCPVNLPAELAIVVGEEIEVTAMTATAGKLCLGAIVGKAGYGCEVCVTLGTKDADGVVLCLFSIVLSLKLLLGFGGILCLEGVKYLKDLASLFKRFDYILCIFARAVHLCLESAIKLHSEGLDALEELLLKVLCIALVAAPRVRNINVGATDILVVIASDNRLNVCGDLTATVILVPRNEKLCLFTKLLKRLYNELPPPENSGRVNGLLYNANLVNNC